MNKLKIIGTSLIGLSWLTNEEWLLIIGIIITVLGMIQDYLRDRKDSQPETVTI